MQIDKFDKADWTLEKEEIRTHTLITKTEGRWIVTIDQKPEFIIENITTINKNFFQGFSDGKKVLIVESNVDVVSIFKDETNGTKSIWIFK